MRENIYKILKGLSKGLIKRTNYRLSQARRYVECSFGILCNKWRIYHRPIDVNVEFAINIVKCCCVLHHFVRDRDGFKFEDSLIIIGMEELEHDNNLYVNRSVKRYRDALANYFVSEHDNYLGKMKKFKVILYYIKIIYYVLFISTLHHFNYLYRILSYYFQ